MLKEFLTTGLVYDVELYKNCLVVTFYSMKAKSYKVFKWYKNTNEVLEMLKLIDKRILAGFNNWFFDNAIIDYLKDKTNCTLLELWQFSQTLINGERNPYRYNTEIKSFDTLEVLRAGYGVTSLKMAAVNLKHERIQDLPIPFDEEVTDEQLELLIDYNINDVEITRKIIDYLMPRLEMRELLSKNYELELHSLSDSGIGKELFNKTYIDRVKAKDNKVDIKKIKYSRTERESIKLSDVISDKIIFLTPEFNGFLSNLKEQVLTKELEIEDEQEL